MKMKPILFGGACLACSALRHSMAFSSSHSGVPSFPIKQVKPFDPVWTVLEDPSGCGMVIVALFTTEAGAAVFTLAMYSGSVFGISSVGRADADVMVRAAEATQNPTDARA
jgi:hypothetical protein